MINKFLHWVAHKFGINVGKVVTWSEEGSIYVGFECSGCSKIYGIDKVPESIFNESKE